MLLVILSELKSLPPETIGKVKIVRTIYVMKTKTAAYKISEIELIYYWSEPTYSFSEKQSFKKISDQQNII